MKHITYVVLLFICSVSIQAQNISGVINDYAEVTGINTCTFTVSSSTGFSAGDQVLVIQMKGVGIDTTNTASFGTINSYSNAGNYEVNTIQSVAGNTIIMQFQPLRNYTVAHKVQLVRIPQYNNAVITNTLTCQPWNGTTGGVLIFFDNGTTTFNADINVSGMGFQGTVAQTTGWINCNATYKMDISTIEALKGESIAILPNSMVKGTGAPANGGGGGRTDNGGGGGGNFGAGGIGGDRGWTNTCNLPAQGGKALTYSNAANKIFLGGAGGDAQRSEGPGINMGVSGGGIVIIKSNSITGNNNNIIAKGLDAANTIQDGAGGGGAGGTVLLDAPAITNALNVNTSGGKGGDAIIYQPVKCSGGGGGGGGVMWVSTPAPNGNIVHTTNGGAFGQSLAPAINGVAGSAGGTLSSLTIPIAIFPCACPTLPTINITSQTNVTCPGGNDGGAVVNASGTLAPYTYVWSNGISATSASGLASGVYTVTVTDANQCFDTMSVNITTPPIITPSVAPANPLCQGDANGGAIASSTGGTSPHIFIWNNTTTATSVSGLAAGTHTLTIVDNNGCSKDTTFTLIDPPLFQINTPAVPAICAGNQAILSAVALGGTQPYTFSWNNNNGIGTSSISVTPSNTTIYSCTVTDANGCTDTSSVVLNVNPLPDVSFIGDSLAGCMPLCVNFTLNSPTAVSASWDFGDGNTSATLSPQNCYTQDGVFSISVTVTDANNCSNSFTQANYVTVFPLPDAQFTALPQPATILSATIKFVDQSTNAVSWNWSFGDVNNSSSSMQNPSFTYSDTGSYQVTLIVTSNNGCLDTVHQTVIVKPDFALYVPNTFTPNADGINDIFLVHGMGIDLGEFNLYIYDRWGNLIFETSDMSKGWNGKANGGADIAQVDTYVWKITLKENQTDRYREFTGHINLIK